jgi:hypothetical protein
MYIYTFLLRMTDTMTFPPRTLCIVYYNLHIHFKDIISTEQNKTCLTGERLLARM